MLSSEQLTIEITQLKMAFQKNAMLRFQDLHKTLDLIQAVGIEALDPGQAGSLTTEEFNFIDTQVFTTSSPYAQVYSVEVTGVGSLSKTQYSLVFPDKVVINDELETGDFVIITYGKSSTSIVPYYTQLETEELLKAKEDKSNKQNSLAKDGTATRYPTIDAINEAFLRNIKLFSRTGITNKKDSFELLVWDNNTVTIGQCDSIIFWDELFTPGNVPTDAIKSFPQTNYPLSQLENPTLGNINTNPITTDGIYVRYIGYTKDGKVISSANNFVENQAIAQLGLLTVIRSAGTISFLGGITPGARNVYSIPILASTDDLQRASTTATTDITIGYNTGAPTLNASSGVITGLSINWKGISNPSNTSSIDKYNFAGDNIVDFISITPQFLSMSTTPVFHTLWTDVQDGAAINSSFYNTTTSLRDTLANNAFGIKRVLVGLKGGIFIQEPEFATSAGYTTIEQAKANIYTHSFTDSIIPPDIVIEIARIIYKKGVTDFSDATQFFIVSTAAGAGAGGGIVSVGDATTLTKGILKLAGDLSGTADLPLVRLITPDNTTGALKIKNTRTLDTSTIQEWQNIAGTTTASIDGNGKITASVDAIVNGLTIGRGHGNIASNTALGNLALSINTTGVNNTAVGQSALQNLGTNNNNVAVGHSSLFATLSSENVAVGFSALQNNTGSGGNVALGAYAGRYIADGTTSLTNTQLGTFLGYKAKALTNVSSNEIVIGNDAIGAGSNTATLGNDSILKTALKGNVIIGQTGAITDDGVNKLQVTGSILATNGFLSKQTIGNRDFQFLDSVGGLTRWSFYRNTAETGGNSGNNLNIARYTDAGGYNGDIIRFLRASGSVEVPNSLLLGGSTDNGTDKLQILGGVRVRSGSLRLNAGFDNTIARPAVGVTRISGEIAGVSSPESNDDGFLRLSAGGGLSALTKTFIDLSGYAGASNLDMRQNIVFGTSGLEKMRLNLNGNLLINTATDSGVATQKLQVNGTVSGSPATLSTEFITKAQSDLKSDIAIVTNIQSATTYTLQNSDNGKQLIFTNAAAITLTIPTGLTSGFNCDVLQQGTGQITFVASATTLQYGSFEFPTTFEKNSIVGIDNVPNLTETYHLYGGLSAI